MNQPPNSPEAEHSVPPFLKKDATHRVRHNTTSSWKSIGSRWPYVAVFILGTLVGWFVLGWYLFPVQYTDTYPTDLRAEIQDDYILMVAESYAATGDLRTAAKRLRYWEPEVLAVKVNQLARSLQAVEPQSATYLQLLARDLHLTPPSSPSTTPPKTTRPSSDFPLSSILGLVVFLSLMAGALFIAQRRGWLDFRRQAQTPEEVDTPNPQPQPQTPTDIPFEDVPVHSMPVEDEEVEDAWDEQAIPPEDATLWDEEAFVAPEEPSHLTEPIPMPENSSLPLHPSPSHPSTIEALEPAEEGDEFLTVPAPPTPSEESDLEEEELASTVRPVVMRFDGTADFEISQPIEIDGTYHGQFGMGAKIPAPHNPALVIGLEVWLYDKIDIRTVSAILVPPVLARDPDLRTAYLDGDDESEIVALEEGETFQLRTAHLMLAGQVVRVTFGPSTSEGVPVIESATIELMPRRAGDMM